MLKKLNTKSNPRNDIEIEEWYSHFSNLFAASNDSK